jgi:predicted ATPase/DNA-binding XRE family transcriptional regulator
MSFATHLRSRRASAGLTQEELAERAGLSPNAVSALERGTRTRPYPHTVRALALALGLEGADLDAFISSARARPVDQPLAPARARVPMGTELDVPLTGLIGREDELTALAVLLEDPHQRLITLTGPGGVGKTRLAVEAARRAAGAFGAGLRFVGLAPLRDATVVESVLAGSLRADADEDGAQGRWTAGAPPERTLLVVDNFEHVMEAAPSIAQLITAHAGLTVLVSSRARLRLRGELEFPVAPLTLPPSTQKATPEELLRSAAGRLFVERARRVQPDFALSPDTAADVAAICWRLGGLPLAVELAAAKMKVLGPGALLERLDEALSTGWARDLPPRQQTLRSTLDWSYRLLEEAERLVFRRLSVFAGGFGLQAAEALVGPTITAAPVLAVLETLIEQSLVTVVREAGAEAYYTMLEPIRQYGRELLRECGEEASASQEHAVYFLDLAERSAPQSRSGDQVLWPLRTEWETDNLRAAMDWALSTGAGETAARLGWALWMPWWSRRQFAEGRHRMEATLQLTLSEPARIRALVVHASMCDAQGDGTAAEQSWEAALSGARRSGDVAGEAYGLAGTGLVAMSRDLGRAGELLIEATVLADRAGEEWLSSLVMIWRGTLLLAGGDPAGATELIEAALRSTRARGDSNLTCVGLVDLAQAAIARHLDDDAEAALVECVELCAEMRTRVNMEIALDLLAVLAGRRRDWRRCAVLLGAAAHMRVAGGAPVHASYMHDAELLARTQQDAESALGSADFDAAHESGQGMDLRAAADYAASR